MRFFIALLILLTTIPLQVAAASERHALVIGNGNYGSRITDLVNPINDATDMASQLSDMGYKVYGGKPALDLDSENFESVLDGFIKTLPENAHAIVYYAGHGMADSIDNYLLPVRNDITRKSQLRKKAVSLTHDILKPLQNKNSKGINVVLLDACRNDPLGNSRGSGGGLLRPSGMQIGTFIGYAADMGMVANDGDGRNGIYTGELLEVLRELPNQIIEVAHKEVAERVYTKTKGGQTPVSENKIFGNWCFGNCAQITTTPPQPEQQPAVAVAAEPAEQLTKSSEISFKQVALGVVAVGALIALTRDSGSEPQSGELVPLTIGVPTP